ncbi:STAS domain-containing protein [Allorhizocola rhizosphaerae]|uniref:STAS domain-containing protein n=1 Tax=Allorhizocola rhizosphaerae TaxID=1872709 RepID=UPI000E3DDED1|nr:STAS domain-containing protein [Allorhizocola rhizosphaerae]
MIGTLYKIERRPVDDGVVRLVLSGEFDLAADKDLGEQLLAVLERDHPAEVCVDLDNVTFIDSTAVHALCRGYQAASSTGTRWYVLNAHGLVRDVLRVTGVWETLSRQGNAANA